MIRGVVFHSIFADVVLFDLNMNIKYTYDCRNKPYNYLKSARCAPYGMTKRRWYFSIVDVVGVLTDSVNHGLYQKMKRDRSYQRVRTVSPPLFRARRTAGGRQRVNCSHDAGYVRIHPVNPLAESGAVQTVDGGRCTDRLDQMQDPELSIQQAMVDYKRLGYSDNWINQRLKASRFVKT